MLVEVGGVGYRVHVPLGVVPTLDPGSNAFLFTHLHVRDDAMVLYGFPTRDERDTFEALLIGDRRRPEARARDPVGAHAGHAAALPRRRRSRRARSLVPGVGKRTAQRLLVDLKARLDVPDLDLTEATGRRVPRRAARCATRSIGPRLLDRRGARRSSASSPTDGTVEELLRDALARSLAGGMRGMREELLSPTADPAEAAEETTLRPRRLDEFVGQPRLREHLEIMLTASRQRGQAVDHVLLAGPPGLGKTTLAGIIATEMGARMQPTSGPALERAGDLAAILTNLDDGDVLFIDEIHRLPRAVEEVLYPAMEDFQLDIVIGKGPSARTIRLDLPALHARRRDDAHRPDHRTAARPLRLRRPARLLRRRRAHARSCAASRRSSASSSSPTARARSRRGAGARRASRTGC